MAANEMQIGYGRGKVSEKRVAPSTISKAIAADAVAASFGQPSRGVTSRRSLKPKFAIARAAAPMFSPSCGSTNMMAGSQRPLSERAPSFLPRHVD